MHGVLEHRNLGEISHSLIVTNLIGFFENRRRETGMLCLPSIRLRLGPTLIRVTDIGIFRGNPPNKSRADRRWAASKFCPKEIRSR